VIQATLAAFAASLWFVVPAPHIKAACLPPGQRCKRSTQCCSGECRKKGRKRRKKCAPLPALAFGCTIDDASCGGSATPCPEIPHGKCEVTHKGRPVCAVEAAANCTECDDNADCLGTLGAGAVCIRCPGCALSGTSCICPFLF
jgi:hypothetical protein